MNATEHLLTCLSEECVEVSKEIHKALRFGLDDKNPLIPNAPTQREMIINELNDLLAVVGMLSKSGEFPVIFGCADKIKAKQEKVSKFMEYARETGALQ